LRKANIIISLFLIAISIFLYYQTITWEKDPATLPRLMLGVIIFLSILLIIKSITKNPKMNKIVKKMSRQSFLRIFIATCITLLYVVSINLLGLYLSTLFFLIIILLYIGEKNKLVIFGVPVLFLIFLYLIFDLFLHVDIPRGIFFNNV